LSAVPAFFRRPRFRYLPCAAITAAAPPLRQTQELPDLLALVASIRRHGLLSPLLVARQRRGRYLLLCGSRRLCAARLAGLEKVPCLIHRGPVQPAVLSLTENLQRRSLSFTEESAAYLRLSQTGVTPERAAELTGIPEERITDMIRAGSLPLPYRSAVQTRQLTVRDALALSRAAEAPSPPPEPAPPRRSVSLPPVSDPRSFLNTVQRGVDALRRGGLAVEYETSAGGELITIRLPAAKTP